MVNDLCLQLNTIAYFIVIRGYRGMILTIIHIGSPGKVLMAKHGLDKGSIFKPLTQLRNIGSAMSGKMHVCRCRMFWRFFLEAEEALWDGNASQEQVDRD